MSIKDAFEVLIEIFHGDRAQFMEDAPDLHSSIGMRVAPIARGDEQPILQVVNSTEKIPKSATPKVSRGGEF